MKKESNGLLKFPTNLLCIFAHPDDELGGVGGTLMKNVAMGGKSHVICFGGCERNRAEELKNACDVLGITHEILGLKEGDYDKEERETTLMLKQKVIDHQPEFLITHRAKWDYHPDHKIVSRIARTAGVMAQNPKKNCIIKGIMYTETHSMHPVINLAVDMSEYMEKVVEAFKCHKSQIEKNDGYYLKLVKGRAKLRGIQMGCDYAEVFLFEPLPLTSGHNRRTLGV